MNYPVGRYRFWIGAGYDGASYEEEYEIPAELGLSVEEWNSLTDIEREAGLDEFSQDYMYNHISTGYEIITTATP